MKVLILIGYLFLAAQSQDYKYINYDSMMGLLDRLSKSRLNNNIFKFSEGFETYGINPRPSCGDEKKFICKNPIIEISNFNKGSDYVSKLPTVLLIGGFHGDEPVGTNALYYMVELFEKNYLTDPYYSNLLDHVRIMVLPMSNVNGFYYTRREEVTGDGLICDPNRDFPYNLAAGNNCFKTSTAILIDAIFRRNLIVGCLTFHGGDNSITYPWGNYAHQNHPETGDHIAFKEIANLLKRAGSNSPTMGVQTYETGTMHRVVYDVNGGFEDWAYGASWDKSNVSKKCALHDNLQVGLYKDNVSYDLSSNRALVYLIEAGHNKIPPEIFLGNEQPLLANGKAAKKWGHVTRNINLSLRFAEAMRPYANVERVSYKNGLIVVLKVHGCVKIDRILKNEFSFTQKSMSLDDIKNEWTMTLEFPLGPGTYKELTFDLVCDKNFSRANTDKNPETHFVKLRTAADYRINFQNNRISSYPIINVKILNIRTDLLNNSIIQWNSKSINSITYSNMLKSVAVNSKTRSQQMVHLIHNKNTLHVQTLAQGSNKKQKEIGVRKFGAMAEKWGLASPRHLAILKSGDDFEASSQIFLSLVGRDVDVYHEGSNQILYTQTLQFDNLNSFEEEMNALFIPPTGLNCRSDVVATPFYFVEVIQEKDLTLGFNLMSEDQEFFGFKVGALKNDFDLVESVRFEGRTLNRYHSKITTKTYDELRLLGRKIEITKNRKFKVLDCTLSVRDPDVGSLIEEEKLDGTVWIWEEEHREKKRNALILLVFMAFLLGIIYYGVKMRQSTFSDRSEKDLAVIINSATSRVY